MKEIIVKYKWLLFLALLVLMINKAHFFFKDAKIQWLLYDVGNATTMMFLACCFFWQVPRKNYFLKSFAFWWMLDSAKEIADIIIDGNRYDAVGLIIQHILFFSCIIFSMYQHSKTTAKKWT